MSAAVQPHIRTARLLLRPFVPQDEAALQRICNDETVARNTASLPFPYTLEHARQFILSLPEEYRTQRSVAYAITGGEGRPLMGTIGLHLQPPHERAVLGYYLGTEYRGKGFATEAAQAMVKFAFERMNLNRVFATVFTYNPASARVLEKAGLQVEGTLIAHIRKQWGFVDEWMYGITRDQWSQFDAAE